VAGISVIETTEQVAVTPSVTYSTLTQMKAGNASLEGRTNIRWYQASHAASAITPVSNGAFTALSTTAWTPVLLNAVTSPADAAFGAVEIEWRHTVTTTVGMFINVDNPAPARSQSDTRIIIRDRATPLNNATLRYRCYAIGYDTNNLPVYSLATVTTAGTVPPVLSTTGFMREPENTFWDGPLQIDSYSRGYALGGEPFAPQGSDYGMVQYDTSPMVETIDYTIWCIGSTALNLLLNQLMLRKTLLVQLALNSVRYIRPMGDATFVQVLAAPLSTDVAAVRSVHKVTFRAVTIQPPNYITKLVTV
jgi:hypothetical protein